MHPEGLLDMGEYAWALSHSKVKYCPVSIFLRDLEINNGPILGRNFVRIQGVVTGV